MSGRRVFTIGDSAHALDALCALPERHGVPRVAEVRGLAVAGGRRAYPAAQRRRA